MKSAEVLRQTAQKIRQGWHPGLALFAVLMGGVCVIITDPGILYTDSTTRIGQAAAINAGRWEDLRAYLTLLPEFFMAFGYRITQSYATYMWAQASFFLWSLLEFIFHFFSGWWRTVVLLLVFTCPLTYGYSVFWEMNVVAAACLLWLFLLDDTLQEPSAKAAPGWYGLRWVLYFILVFVMVGYRLNAAPAAIGLLCWGALRAWRGKKPWRSLLPQAAAILCGTALAFSFSRLVGVHGSSNAALGFGWEICCMVNDAQDGSVQEELDALLGEGWTEIVLACEDPNVNYCGAGFGALYDATLRRSGDIYRLYAKMVYKHPLSFLRVKARMIRGLFSILPDPAYDNEPFAFAENTPRRLQFCAIVQGYLAKAAALRTPWLLFTLSAMLGIAAWRRRHSALTLKMFFVAALFQSGFFITTQGFEFRYFFPAFVTLVFSCFAAVGAGIDSRRAQTAAPEAAP